jgi:hypothetical protein
MKCWIVAAVCLIVCLVVVVIVSKETRVGFQKRQEQRLNNSLDE